MSWSICEREQQSVSVDQTFFSPLSLTHLHQPTPLPLSNLSLRSPPLTPLLPQRRLNAPSTLLLLHLLDNTPRLQQRADIARVSQMVERFVWVLDGQLGDVFVLLDLRVDLGVETRAMPLLVVGREDEELREAQAVRGGVVPEAVQAGRVRPRSRLSACTSCLYVSLVLTWYTQQKPTSSSPPHPSTSAKGSTTPNSPHPHEYSLPPR